MRGVAKTIIQCESHLAKIRVVETSWYDLDHNRYFRVKNGHGYASILGN